MGGCGSVSRRRRDAVQCGWRTWGGEGGAGQVVWAVAVGRKQDMGGAHKLCSRERACESAPPPAML